MKRWAFVLLTILSAQSHAAVTTSARGDEIIVANDAVTLTISKNHTNVRSIVYRHGGAKTEMGDGSRALYFDVNAGSADPSLEDEKGPKAGYQSLGDICKTVALGQHTPEMAEVVFSGQPVKWFPFETELHVVVRSGVSGFYAYTIFRHGPGMAGGSIGQCRFVMRGPANDRLYSNHIVDDQRMGPFPTSKVVETVQDATFRLADGSVYTKYNNTAFNADDQVHGMAGHGVGAWVIWPGQDFLNGGPLRQDLTVHMDNTLLAMFQGGHFGAGGVRVSQDEAWSRFYGPVFFYMNSGNSVPAMWTDAKEAAAHERSEWPLAWVHDRDYPLARGTVAGTIKLTDGEPTTGAWAVLAPPDSIDWPLSANGYMYWTKVDANGHFEIPKVRPGTYNLFLSGANQFVDFKKAGVTVTADATTDLGSLAWTPVKHGTTLWQIGVADRSSSEFFDGNNVRHYGNFLRYPAAFPHDVTFIVGKSDPAKDWNFAQWSWYASKPTWAIRFDEPRPLRGQATLTIGLAEANLIGDLQVHVNGKEVAHLHLKKSGAAAYRSGGQDSTYNLCPVTFDASLIKAGTNEITLGDSRAVPFAEATAGHKPLGAVMYDAIRLEVQPQNEQ